MAPRQGALFPNPDGGTHRVEVFDLPDARLELVHGFLGADLADRTLAALRDDTDWVQERMMMYGREVSVPRLTAWYGDADSVYVYSGTKHVPRPWTAMLVDLRESVRAAAGERFNSVLLNYYRDGSDSVAWHSDDEPELGPAPVIASLSLGAERVFQLKHKSRKDLPRVDIDLPHGGLLIMGGDCQRSWLHQVPKRRGRQSPGPRINLTFRVTSSGTIARVPRRPTRGPPGS